MSKIAAARQKRGLSQAELARRIGMFPQNLCRLEKGPGQPSSRTLRKLAKALGCPIDRLI